MAPFITAQAGDLATVLVNQNFLKAFETARPATDALPLIRADVTRLKTELEAQKAHSISQLTEIARLTRSLDLALNAAAAGSCSSRSQDITALDKFAGDRKTYRAFEAQLKTKLAGDVRKFRDDQHKMMYITLLLEGNANQMIHPYIVND